jgi:hypothetical protein
LTDAEELTVLSSIPASAAASPAPSALAEVPAPSLFAAALPSASESAVAVPLAASVDELESASMCALADAEPSPDEAADTSTVEDDDAEAVPSSLVAELVPVAVPVPLIEPPPVVETSTSASAPEEALAELLGATGRKHRTTVVAISNHCDRATLHGGNRLTVRLEWRAREDSNP